MPGPLNQQAVLEAQLARGVAGHAAGRRLCTVPGVGPVTAAAVVATLDDVGRFASAGRWRSSDSSFCAPRLRGVRRA
jgi:transposase